MKTDQEWIDENPDMVLWNEEISPDESRPVIRAIQADALEHAAQIVREQDQIIDPRPSAKKNNCPH